MRKELPGLTALLACVGTTALATPVVIDDSDGAPDYTETGPIADTVNVTPTNAYNGTARAPHIPSGTGPVTGTWTWTGLTAGLYDVAAYWAATGAPGNRSDNAAYEIVSDLDTVNVVVSQEAVSIADYTVNDDANNSFDFQTLGQIEVGAGGQIALTLTGGVSPDPPDLRFEYFDAALVNRILLGDLNLDGSVNGQDLAIMAANFGNSGQTLGTGDITGEGDVNGQDLAILAANFGAGDVAQAGTNAVPEPGSLALLTLAGLALTRRRR